MFIYIYTYIYKSHPHAIYKVCLFYFNFIQILQGLLQMQFLPRIRYIMEMCHPSEAALVNCLCILIRLVQHIPETAYSVFKFPRFIEVVLKLLSVNSGDEVNLHAIKLLLFICLSGRNMASSLVGISFSYWK